MIGLRTHKRVVPVGDAANLAVCGHLAQPVEWKPEVWVLLKTAAIKVGAYVGHHHIGKIDVSWEQAVVDRAEIKRRIRATVQSRGRDDCNG